MNDIERRLRDLGERTAQEVTYREAPRGRIVRRARMRRGLIVAAPVAAVVLFAAVAYPRLGSDAERRVGVPVSVDLAAAAEATEREGSARMEMTFAMELDGQSYTSKMSGEIDFDDFRSYFRMTEEGDFAGFGDLEVIWIGRVMFSRPLGETKWVKSKVDTPAGGSPFGAGPDELFTYLESVSEGVTSLGEEVLDGVPVTHLRATIDTSALAEMPMTTGIDYGPFDVWIDDANRVRKITLGATTPGADASSSGTMSMTTRFWDFGVAVDVAAPSPEDVTDEPPASWDAGGGESIGYEVGGGDGPSGTWSGETTYVTGPRGYDEPFVVLNSPKAGVYIVCLENSPRRWTKASIVESGAGRRVASFGGAGRGSAGQGGGVTCSVSPGISEQEAEHLIADPEEYSLRFTTARGDLVVPLTTSSGG